jgi:hypothetical protein
MAAAHTITTSLFWGSMPTRAKLVLVAAPFRNIYEMQVRLSKPEHLFIAPLDYLMHQPRTYLSTIIPLHRPIQT